jgi:hypothetical protein
LKRKVKKKKIPPQCDNCHYAVGWWEEKERPSMDEYKKAKTKSKHYLYPIWCEIRKKFYKLEHTCKKWEKMK